MGKLDIVELSYPRGIVIVKSHFKISALLIFFYLSILKLLKGIYQFRRYLQVIPKYAGLSKLLRRLLFLRRSEIIKTTRIPEM